MTVRPASASRSGFLAMSPSLHQPVVHIRQQTIDFDECVDTMSRIWPARGRPDFVGDRFESTNNTVAYGSATFGDNFCSAGLRLEDIVFPGTHLLTIPLAGVSTHTFGHRTRTASRGDVVLHPADQPLSLTTETDSSVFQVTLDASSLHREATAFVGDEQAGCITWNPAWRPGPVHLSPIRGMADIIVSQLRARQFTTSADGQRMAHLTNALVRCLIEEQAVAWRLPDAVPDVAPASVILAEEYIRENLRDAITMEDLASITGVTARSLQRSFRKRRGVTPLVFQRDLRLEESRRQLLADARVTVTSVATGLGFNHMGRFSQHYRRKFGELPLETRRRHRPPLHG